MAILTGINKANALIGNYTFASSSGNYSTLTGGTTFLSGTWDDGATTTLVTIPFSFTYNGTAYTSLGIDANGFITLGSLNTDVYCGLQTSPVNSISAYGTDLVGASASSSITYGTRGSSPNRQFVIQWSDCDHYGNGAVNHWNFQIILNETTNTVQVVWGTSTDVTTMGANTCADVGTESGSVGLVGSVSTDFNLRSVTNGTNTWASSVAGGAINAVCNMSSTNIPANGLTYTWTPGAAVAMSYTSSTTSFLNNASGIPQNSTGNQVLQIQVVTTGTTTPFTLSSLNLSTTGSTNASTDILNAKVYYTGSSNVFATTTQFGSTVASPNGAYTVSGSAVLSEGVNYFWVTYDIKSTATANDVITGCCTQITGSGTMGARTPTVTCPSGSQTISGPVGTWTQVATASPHTNGGETILLSDGTVLAKTSAGGTDGYGNTWDKLTPDSHGSYVNGTWSSIAPMINTRLYFSTQVLKDGRVYVAGGEYGTGGTAGEVYNPLTNTWTATPAPSGTVSDANSTILEDGRVLQALVTGALKSTQIYNPVTNTYVAGPTSNGIHNESVWVKLPDNSILFVDRLATSSERYIPASNTWVTDATVPVSLYDSFGDETGGAELMPNGKVFFLGATGHTAIYTPSGTTSPGSWIAGPDVPGAKGAPDAPLAMMVNGKILCIVSPVPTSANHFPSPSNFYEYDYQTNNFTLIGAPGGGTTLTGSPYVTNFLDLPDGNVLYSKQGTSTYYVYTPNGSPVAAGKPAVTSITQTACSTYTAKGTLFNGISEGASYGDDWQMTTNYPIVRLTSGSNVYYARTFNWNSTGVSRGAQADSTQFTLPSGLPAGTYSLQVIANGIASDAVSFTPAATPVLSSSLNPASICSNTNFVYTPTSTSSNPSFTWTRAAFSGISNAAITTAQTSNPNELLINTTNSSVNVVYAYTITSNGCSNAQNVTVAVKPTSSSSTSLTVCAGQLPYSWNSNSFSAAGTYVVHLTNAQGCDSAATLILSVNPAPSAPTGTNNSRCGTGTVVLSATPGTGETIDWYSSASGGTLLLSGSNSYTTPGISSTTNYYAQARNTTTGCVSVTRTMVTATITNCSVTINLKVYLQGYYIGSGLMQPTLKNEGIGTSTTKTDTVTLELHNSASPHALATPAVKAVINTDGTGSFVFPSISGSYYLVVKHRNSIETWSNAPVSLSSTVSYDFTTAANKAYGNNMIQIGTIWAVYTGDLNQDGFVDPFDYPAYDSNNQNGVSVVYINTDMNGDGFVDPFDYPVFDSNNQNGVAAIIPN